MCAHVYIITLCVQVNVCACVHHHSMRAGTHIHIGVLSAGAYMCVDAWVRYHLPLPEQVRVHSHINLCYASLT